MDLLDGIKAFVATAETGSFTGAAKRLGISNRLTSKYVAELEERLGTRLLQRTTRRVGLTPAGEELLSRAPAMLDEMDDMLGAVREDAKGFSGMLRISAPVSFGEIYVADMLQRFATPHPDLTIDLRLDDAFGDLASEGIDLAFRIGESSISSLKQRKLGHMSAKLVASPDYIAKHGAPETPRDLVDHTCFLDTNRRSAERWEFTKNGALFVAETVSKFHANSARVARNFARNGRGVAYCPDFVFEDDFQSGQLVQLMPDFESPGLLLSAVYLETRRLPRKVRALIDFAVEDVRKAGLV